MLSEPVKIIVDYYDRLNVDIKGPRSLNGITSLNGEGTDMFLSLALRLQIFFSE